MRLLRTQKRSLRQSFNPRICKRCDILREATSPSFFVSIHASVKDATGYYVDTFLDMDVSIHASVKDATCVSKLHLLISTRFNPRICKRCDLVRLLNSLLILRFNPRICKRCDHPSQKWFAQNHVSIHASVKDATKKWAEAYAHVRVSIHASVKDATC